MTLGCCLEGTWYFAIGAGIGAYNSDYLNPCIAKTAKRVRNCIAKTAKRVRNPDHLYSAYCLPGFARGSPTARQGAAPSQPSTRQGVGEESQKPNWIHDVPVAGIFTSAVVDNCWYGPAVVDLEAAFAKFDTAKTGKLGKQGVVDACRHVGKSERQVQKILDSMEAKDVDVDGFKQLFYPERPWYYWMGPIPLPNHEKVLDLPVLGNVLCTAGDVIAQPVDGVLRASWSCLNVPSDEALGRMFRDADSRGGGTLQRHEVATLMRQLGMTEVQINANVDKLYRKTGGNEPSLYEIRLFLYGPKFTPSLLHSVPFVGQPVSDNMLTIFDNEIIRKHDIKEAFEYVDKEKKGTLDKTEIAEVLRLLGRPESLIQTAIDQMEEEELDYTGFTLLTRGGKARPWITSLDLGYAIPLPNPAKIHDVPIVGAVTKTTSDVLYDTYDWTCGAAFRTAFPIGEDELKETFKEADADADGKLSRKDAAKLLRSMGKKEWEIKGAMVCLQDGKAELSVDEFAAWVYAMRLFSWFRSADAAEDSGTSA
jgi:Ca2+-binding EF-hand superfamily protein